MSRPSVRRPDRIQKIFLWLILAAWALVFFSAFMLDKLSNFRGAILLVLLCIFHLALTRIAYFRARRDTDNYIIYPLVGSCFACFALLFFYLI